MPELPLLTILDKNIQTLRRDILFNHVRFLRRGYLFIYLRKMSKETGVVPETSARVHFDIMNISSGQQGDGRSRRKNSSDKFFVRHRRALTDKKEKKKCG